MLNVNFALSSNNKDHLRELYNDFEELITVIDAGDGSALAYNIRTSCQVDYLSSAFIPAGAVKNYQEHLVATRYKVTFLI